jgi:hypothetical protein
VAGSASGAPTAETVGVARRPATAAVTAAASTPAATAATAVAGVAAATSRAVMAAAAAKLLEPRRTFSATLVPMLDWLGSVQIRTRSSTRVELDLTRATAWTGWGLTALGVGLVVMAPLWATLLGVIVIGMGVLLATLRRKLVFDREEGLLRSEQRILGIRRRAAIPLFHLRAVVVSARRGGIYIAYVERRVGGTIHLDEARRPGGLVKLAEAISEVAELRFIYDATTRVAALD